MRPTADASVMANHIDQAIDIRESLACRPTVPMKNSPITTLTASRPTANPPETRRADRVRFLGGFGMDVSCRERAPAAHLKYREAFVYDGRQKRSCRSMHRRSRFMRPNV